MTQMAKGSIYQDLDLVREIAILKAKEHGCNYTIILCNPVDSELGEGSTYEFVADSYFDKDRPNCIKLDTTDILIKNQKAHQNIATIGHIDHGKSALAAALMACESSIVNPMSHPDSNGTSFIENTYKDVESGYPGMFRTQVPQYIRDEPKIGRNNPCSCGSGKKYKKCCI